MLSNLRLLGLSGVLMKSCLFTYLTYHTRSTYVRRTMCVHFLFFSAKKVLPCKDDDIMASAYPIVDA